MDTNKMPMDVIFVIAIPIPIVLPDALLCHAMRMKLPFSLTQIAVPSVFPNVPQQSVLLLAACNLFITMENAVVDVKIVPTWPVLLSNIAQLDGF